MIEMVNVNIKMLEKMNEQKKQFIDCFTHEIKTPITAIIGYAALLQTTKLDKKTFKDSLDFIYSEGKRLEELSISLMNLMFVQKNEYKMVKLDIRIIMEYVKRSMEMRLKKKKIELIIDAEGVFIVAEEQLIKMLFINLIDNAIKASDMGDKIIITVKDNNNEIVVSVKDFGIGIDNKHMEFITEPFYMVDKARSRENNGAGLGLAIVSKIVELHKGNIRIKSKKNEGTEIIVAFLKGGSTE
jgi:signal transduction histidine kinase